MYKISVIIPIYNAENNIESIVNSLINQSLGFENIELILVDDCSTDKSREIIANYDKRFNNIKTIFLNENSGSPSKPRNFGIDNATAPYIIFLDSDDDIFNEYCEVLYEHIVDNNVDIVCCNHSTKLNNSIYIPKSILEINYAQKICNDTEKLLLDLVVWGNIFKTSLIKDNKIYFPNTLHEDGVFTLNCLLNTEKRVIKLLNFPGYIYQIDDEDSLSHKLDLKSLLKFFEGYRLCGSLLDEDKHMEVKQRMFNTFTRLTIFSLIKLPSSDLDEGIKLLYDFENNIEFKITLNSKLLDVLNSKIMNKQFFQAKLLLKILGFFYNNKIIKNYIYIKYNRLKLLKD